ncbi:MAG: DUF6502 family protein [Woeseiaceae bacterium]
MREQNKNKLNKAFLFLLQPIARLFLRFGRGYREFSELSKAAFVVVAGEDYGVHGRPTNVSRIAAMTGLTRKEISRIRSRIDNGEAHETERGTPLQEVIEAWRSSDEFLHCDGEPAALGLGGGPGSFQSLIKQFAGDIPEGAMRKELQRIGAIELVDESVRLQSEGPGNEQAEDEMAGQLRAGPYPLLAALAHNDSIFRESDRWPLETVGPKSIRRSDMARVRNLVSTRLRAATSNIADLLDSYATLYSGEGTDEPMVAVSTGVFYVEGPEDPDQRANLFGESKRRREI